MFQEPPKNETPCNVEKRRADQATSFIDEEEKDYKKR
jgi:hypothetical protein